MITTRTVRRGSHAGFGLIRLGSSSDYVFMSDIADKNKNETIVALHAETNYLMRYLVEEVAMLRQELGRIRQDLCTNQRSAVPKAQTRVRA